MRKLVIAATVATLLLTPAACTASTPPPLPAPSITPSTLPPVSNASIIHDVPTALRNAQFFDRPISDFDITVVPSATFEKIRPSDPRITSTERHIDRYPWCSNSDVEPIGQDTHFALHTHGGTCNFDTPHTPVAGILNGNVFTPFAGYRPDPIETSQYSIGLTPLSYTDDGVVLVYSEVSKDRLLHTDVVYARADTMTMHKVVSLADLEDIDSENYYIHPTMSFGAWVNADTLFLSMFMTTRTENTQYGLGIISIDLNGSNPRVELFNATTQRWTQHDEPLFSTLEDGHMALLRRTNGGRYEPVYTNTTESSSYLPQRVDNNWAGMMNGQLLIAVDAGLILADEQAQTITIIEMNPVPGTESGHYLPDPQFTDTHLLWLYVPYNSQYSGVYALNHETLAGVMTLVDGQPGDLRVASDNFTVDLYRFVYEVGEKYLETHIPLP